MRALIVYLIILSSCLFQISHAVSPQRTGDFPLATIYDKNASGEYLDANSNTTEFQSLAKVISRQEINILPPPTTGSLEDYCSSFTNPTLVTVNVQSSTTEGPTSYQQVQETFNALEGITTKPFDILSIISGEPDQPQTTYPSIYTETETLGYSEYSALTTYSQLCAVFYNKYTLDEVTKGLTPPPPTLQTPEAFEYKMASNTLFIFDSLLNDIQGSSSQSNYGSSDIDVFPSVKTVQAHSDLTLDTALTLKDDLCSVFTSKDIQKFTSQTSPVYLKTQTWFDNIISYLSSDIHDISQGANNALWKDYCSPPVMPQPTVFPSGKGNSSSQTLYALGYKSIPQTRQDSLSAGTIAENINSFDTGLVVSSQASQAPTTHFLVLSPSVTKPYLSTGIQNRPLDASGKNPHKFLYELDPNAFKNKISDEIKTEAINADGSINPNFLTTTGNRSSNPIVKGFALKSTDGWVNHPSLAPNLDTIINNNSYILSEHDNLTSGAWSSNPFWTHLINKPTSEADPTHVDNHHLSKKYSLLDLYNMGFNWDNKKCSSSTDAGCVLAFSLYLQASGCGGFSFRQTPLDLMTKFDETKSKTLLYNGSNSFPSNDYFQTLTSEACALGDNQSIRADLYFNLSYDELSQNNFTYNLDDYGAILPPSYFFPPASVSVGRYDLAQMKMARYQKANNTGAKAPTIDVDYSTKSLTLYPNLTKYNTDAKNCSSTTTAVAEDNVTYCIADVCEADLTFDSSLGMCVDEDASTEAALCPSPDFTSISEPDPLYFRKSQYDGLCVVEYQSQPTTISNTAPTSFPMDTISAESSRFSKNHGTWRPSGRKGAGLWSASDTTLYNRVKPSFVPDQDPTIFLSSDTFSNVDFNGDFNLDIQRFGKSPRVRTTTKHGMPSHAIDTCNGDRNNPYTPADTSPYSCVDIDLSHTYRGGKWGTGSKRYVWDKRTITKTDMKYDFGWVFGYNSVDSKYSTTNFVSIPASSQLDTLPSYYKLSYISNVNDSSNDGWYLGYFSGDSNLTTNSTSPITHIKNYYPLAKKLGSNQLPLSGTFDLKIDNHTLDLSVGNSTLFNISIDPDTGVFTDNDSDASTLLNPYISDISDVILSKNKFDNQYHFHDGRVGFFNSNQAKGTYSNVILSDFDTYSCETGHTRNKNSFYNTNERSCSVITEIKCPTDTGISNLQLLSNNGKHSCGKPIENCSLADMDITYSNTGEASYGQCKYLATNETSIDALKDITSKVFYNKFFRDAGSMGDIKPSNLQGAILTPEMASIFEDYLSDATNPSLFDTNDIGQYKNLNNLLMSSSKISAEKLQHISDTYHIDPVNSKPLFDNLIGMTKEQLPNFKIDTLGLTYNVEARVIRGFGITSTNDINCHSYETLLASFPEDNPFQKLCVNIVPQIKGVWSHEWDPFQDSQALDFIIETNSNGSLLKFNSKPKVAIDISLSSQYAIDMSDEDKVSFLKTILLNDANSPNSVIKTAISCNDNNFDIYIKQTNITDSTGTKSGDTSGVVKCGIELKTGFSRSSEMPFVSSSPTNMTDSLAASPNVELNLGTLEVNKLLNQCIDNLSQPIESPLLSFTRQRDAVSGQWIEFSDQLTIDPTIFYPEEKTAKAIKKNLIDDESLRKISIFFGETSITQNELTQDIDGNVIFNDDGGILTPFVTPETRSLLTKDVFNQIQQSFPYYDNDTVLTISPTQFIQDSSLTSSITSELLKLSTSIKESDNSQLDTKSASMKIHDDTIPLGISSLTGLTLTDLNSFGIFVNPTLFHDNDQNYIYSTSDNTLTLTRPSFSKNASSQTSLLDEVFHPKCTHLKAAPSLGSFHNIDYFTPSDKFVRNSNTSEQKSISDMYWVSTRNLDSNSPEYLNENPDKYDYFSYISESSEFSFLQTEAGDTFTINNPQEDASSGAIFEYIEIESPFDESINATINFTLDSSSASNIVDFRDPDGNDHEDIQTGHSFIIPPGSSQIAILSNLWDDTTSPDYTGELTFTDLSIDAVPSNVLASIDKYVQISPFSDKLKINFSTTDNSVNEINLTVDGIIHTVADGDLLGSYEPNSVIHLFANISSTPLSSIHITTDIEVPVEYSNSLHQLNLKTSNNDYIYNKIYTYSSEPLYEVKSDGSPCIPAHDGLCDVNSYDIKFDLYESDFSNLEFSELGTEELNITFNSTNYDNLTNTDKTFCDQLYGIPTLNIESTLISYNNSCLNTAHGNKPDCLNSRSIWVENCSGASDLAGCPQTITTPISTYNNSCLNPIYDNSTDCVDNGSIWVENCPDSSSGGCPAQFTYLDLSNKQFELQNPPRVSARGTTITYEGASISEILPIDFMNSDIQNIVSTSRFLDFLDCTEGNLIFRDNTIKCNYSNTKSLGFNHIVMFDLDNTAQQIIQIPGSSISLHHLSNPDFNPENFTLFSFDNVANTWIQDDTLLLNDLNNKLNELVELNPNYKIKLYPINFAVNDDRPLLPQSRLTFSASQSHVCSDVNYSTKSDCNNANADWLPAQQNIDIEVGKTISEAREVCAASMQFHDDVYHEIQEKTEFYALLKSLINESDLADEVMGSTSNQISESIQSKTAKQKIGFFGWKGPSVSDITSSLVAEHFSGQGFVNYLEKQCSASGAWVGKELPSYSTKLCDLINNYLLSDYQYPTTSDTDITDIGIDFNIESFANMSENSSKFASVNGYKPSGQKLTGLMFIDSVNMFISKSHFYRVNSKANIGSQVLRGLAIHENEFLNQLAGAVDFNAISDCTNKLSTTGEFKVDKSLFSYKKMYSNGSRFLKNLYPKVLNMDATEYDNPNYNPFSINIITSPDPNLTSGLETYEFTITPTGSLVEEDPQDSSKIIPDSDRNNAMLFCNNLLPDRVIVGNDTLINNSFAIEGSMVSADNTQMVSVPRVSSGSNFEDSKNNPNWLQDKVCKDSYTTANYQLDKTKIDATTPDICDGSVYSTSCAMQPIGDFGILDLIFRYSSIKREIKNFNENAILQSVDICDYNDTDTTDYATPLNFKNKVLKVQIPTQGKALQSVIETGVLIDTQDTDKAKTSLQVIQPQTVSDYSITDPHYPRSLLINSFNLFNSMTQKKTGSTRSIKTKYDNDSYVPNLSINTTDPIEMEVNNCIDYKGEFYYKKVASAPDGLSYYNDVSLVKVYPNADSDWNFCDTRNVDSDKLKSCPPPLKHDSAPGSFCSKTDGSCGVSRSVKSCSDILIESESTFSSLADCSMTTNESDFNECRAKRKKIFLDQYQSSNNLSFEITDIGFTNSITELQASTIVSDGGATASDDPSGDGMFTYGFGKDKSSGTSNLQNQDLINKQIQASTHNPSSDLGGIDSMSATNPNSASSPISRLTAGLTIVSGVISAYRDVASTFGSDDSLEYVDTVLDKANDIVDTVLDKANDILPYVAGASLINDLISHSTGSGSINNDIESLKNTETAENSYISAASQKDCVSSNLSQSNQVEDCVGSPLDSASALYDRVTAFDDALTQQSATSNHNELYGSTHINEYGVLVYTKGTATTQDSLLKQQQEREDAEASFSSTDFYDISKNVAEVYSSNSSGRCSSTTESTKIGCSNAGFEWIMDSDVIDSAYNSNTNLGSCSKPGISSKDACDLDPDAYWIKTHSSSDYFKSNTGKQNHSLKRRFEYKTLNKNSSTYGITSSLSKHEDISGKNTTTESNVDNTINSLTDMDFTDEGIQSYQNEMLKFQKNDNTYWNN